MWQNCGQNANTVLYCTIVVYSEKQRALQHCSSEDDDRAGSHLAADGSGYVVLYCKDEDDDPDNGGHSTVLHCTVLCTVLYCAVLQHNAPHHNTAQQITLQLLARASRLCDESKTL